MTVKNKSLLAIHCAVLLFGISSLFGKWLALPPLTIVFGRVLFSSLFLLGVLKHLKISIKLRSTRDYNYLIIMGIILAVHWLSFFKAIQTSTVAIGLLTFSSFPIFVTFLEPYCFKEKLKLSDFWVALLSLFGVLLVVPEFNVSSHLTQGVLWGLVSGLSYGVLSLMNRKYVADYSSIVVAFYEQAIACILLIPLVCFQRVLPTPQDIGLLVLLGVLFTAVSHTLFISGLKNVRTQTASIISALEPIYGIVLAIITLGEWPSSKEVIGGMIILGAVLYSSITTKK